eukprot:5250295-Pyramimonas_sp.AAC.1
MAELIPQRRVATKDHPPCRQQKWPEQEPLLAAPFSEHAPAPRHQSPPKLHRRQAPRTALPASGQAH